MTTRQLHDGERAPLVSVIIPCRDEGGHIADCLDSLVAQDWPRDRMEVFVVDGMSTDGTREVVARYAAQHPWIHLVDNPQRVTPVALNTGIRRAQGEIICRMDVHCRYPHDYLSSLVAELTRSGADNVGGVCRTLPAADAPMPRAIAVALAHPLAVGNAHFRIGASEPRWVDTVPFGCYRRSVFDRIGLFDEELVRNQDDEFNHRLLRSGGRILLVPSVVIDYFARATLSQLGRMMYQYGLFKPLAARKLGGATTVRQLVPPAFVAALGATLALSPVSVVMRALFLLIVMAYAMVLLLVTVRQIPGDGAAVALRLLAAIPTIHLAYGAGYLWGIWEFVIRARRLQGRGDAIPVTR